MQSWQLNQRTFENEEIVMCWEPEDFSKSKKWQNQMILQVLSSFKIHRIFNMVQIVSPVDSLIARKTWKMWSGTILSKVTWAPYTLVSDWEGHAQCFIRVCFTHQLSSASQPSLQSWAISHWFFPLIFVSPVIEDALYCSSLPLQCWSVRYLNTRLRQRRQNHFCF